MRIVGSKRWEQGEKDLAEEKDGRMEEESGEQRLWWHMTT
jgi:hypothetical protein